MKKKGFKLTFILKYAEISIATFPIQVVTCWIFGNFLTNVLALVSNVPAFSEHKPDWPNNGFVCVYELKQVLLFHCLCKLENQPYTSILTTRTASLRIHPFLLALRRWGR